MVLSRFELPPDASVARDVCLAQRMPAGDPGELRSVALRSGALAAELRSTARVLVSGTGSTVWSGKAQQALADTLRAKAPHLESTAKRYESYAAALSSYAGTMDTATPRLRRLRGELASRTGMRRMPLGGAASAPGWTQVPSSRAGSGLIPVGGVSVGGVSVGSVPGGSVPGGSVPGGTAGGLQGQAVHTDVAQAAAMAAEAAQLSAYARQFKAAYDQWADALDRCCFALLRADAGDPTRDPHGLAALGRQLDRIAKYVAPIDYMLMHPTLKNASECLGILSTELSVIGLALLFICPPAGAACLAVATVVAAAQLVTDVVRRSRGEHVSATTLGLDAMGALPVGGRAFAAGRDAGLAAHALAELAPGARTVSRVVPGGGLAAHEAAGGHMLSKHVGKSEEFLMQRLAKEPHLTSASTFFNREIAEEKISEVLASNAKETAKWLTGVSPQLTLAARTPAPIGLALSRGESVAEPAAGLKLILRRSISMQPGYYIHTAMVTP